MPRLKSHKPKVATAKQTVLLDTGPIVGLYNEKDDWHERCMEFFGSITHYEYLLTHAVICEVLFHIQQDKHTNAASAAAISFDTNSEQCI